MDDNEIVLSVLIELMISCVTKRSLMQVTTYHLLPYWVHERADVEMWWEEKGNLKLLLLKNDFYNKAIVFCYKY